MHYNTTIDIIIEKLRNAHKSDTKCAILIGAGCSVSAGIPVGSGIIKRIAQDFPASYNKLPENYRKDYFKVMAVLTETERRTLINDSIKNAKLNWAHICIALLIKEGYVDRVLTTNFDPLVVKSCAMLSEFPAVYDITASDGFQPELIHDKAIIYLHGQHTGFVQINTGPEHEKLSERLKPIFDDTLQKHIIIVIGYSGEADPVFKKNLANVTQFNNGLYWIGHNDNDAGAHLTSTIFQKDKSAFYTKGYDADSFLIKLAQELNIFPPDIFEKPFTHLNALMDTIVPYILPMSDKDITDSTRQLIRKGIDTLEVEFKKEDDQKEKILLMQGKFSEVQELLETNPRLTDKQKDNLAWSYIMMGNALLMQARTKTGAEANILLKEACDKYDKAVMIKPDKHEAFNNWGSALSDQAITKTGAEANRLFKEACDKYDKAVMIKPDKHEAFYNWGCALSAQARTKTGDEANRLFKKAYDKYDKAVM
ncbi:hypothetical protein EPN18_07055, partial [bacterium]